MIKTVKGKVIAGVLAVGLVSGGGVALGASDAGANLKAWYDGQFKQSSTTVTNDVAAYASGKVVGLTSEYNGLKTDATNSINAKGKSDAGVTNKNIDEKSKEHIAAIAKEKENIDFYLSSQFDSLTTFANGLIIQAGKDALDYAAEDLANHTLSAGKVAVDNVNNEVKAVTADAVKNLEEAIKAAKGDLQAQLDKETGLTVDEIKVLIDKKIVELRKTVTVLKNGLVAKQEKLITMKAKELLLAAEAEMDALVKGINGK